MTESDLEDFIRSIKVAEPTTALTEAEIAAMHGTKVSDCGYSGTGDKEWPEAALNDESKKKNRDKK